MLWCGILSKMQSLESQLWDISDYCVHVMGPKPVTRPPPLLLAWRAHLSSIVSINLAESKGLVVTASTDCCVRVWTMQGRYIGETNQHDSTLSFIAW